MPSVAIQRLRFAACETPCVRKSTPQEPHLDVGLSKHPEGFFRSFVAFVIRVEHDADATGGFGLGYGDDAGELLVGDVVAHDADAGDTEFAKAEDVPEAFDDQQAVLLQRILQFGPFERLLAV